MNDSILTSVKKLLGIAEECTDFDPDIVMYINSTLMALTQMGVGDAGGYFITGADETWQNYLGEKAQATSAITPYVAAKVRLMGFDPPSSSTGMEALKNTVAELEWRLYSAYNFSEEKPDDAEENTDTTDSTDKTEGTEE